ncbi:MAG: hypothetical protein ABIM99_04925 [Candidatus Dojkabacteria bacterium]
MRKTFSKVLAAASAVVAYSLLATPVFAQSYVYDYGYTDAAAATGLAGFSFVWALCACCIPLIINGVIAYYIYKDAKKNHIDNEAVWAIVGFFFSLLGLLVYFLVPRAEAMKKMEGRSMDKKPEDKM